jgi:hypothetical protein
VGMEESGSGIREPWRMGVMFMMLWMVDMLYVAGVCGS